MKIAASREREAIGFKDSIVMSFISRLVRIWVDGVLRCPKTVLAIAFASALASVFYTAAKLEMLTDQLELIAEDHPLIALTDRIDPFIANSKRRLDVVIEAPDPYRAVSFANELASRIKRDTDHFQDVFYRVDPDLFKSWQLLYLDREDLLSIREKIASHGAFIQKLAERPELLSFLQLLNEEMTSRMIGELFTGFLEDEPPQDGDRKPFDLGILLTTLRGMAGFMGGDPEFQSPWTSLFSAASWNPELEGYFWENGKRYLLAFVTPQKTASGGVVPTEGSLKQLRQYIEEVKGAFPDVRAGVTGQEALNNDEMNTVLDDMKVATWLSILGVFILLVLFRRSFRRPLLQAVSLCVGLCWSFGAATLLVGHLNMISVVFAPLLCGLGVDSAIHWFSRLEEEERLSGGSIEALIRTVADRSGPGIFLAGLGTTLSFLPFVLTGFRGLVELGLIAGVGIFLNLVADFTVLPALTLLSERRVRKPAFLQGRPEPKDFIRFNSVSGRAVLWGAGILAFFSLLSASQVYFDLNPLRLQTVNAESVVWGKHLIENSRRSVLFASSFAHSPEEAAARSRALESLPSVGEVVSAFSLIPANQDEKLPILLSMHPMIPTVRPTVLESTPSDREAFIDVLERILFKLRDEEAEKWGAERPVVEQIAEARALASGVIETLRGSPDAMDRLQDYRRRFLEDLQAKWDTLKKGTDTSPMTVEDLPELLKGWFYQNGVYLIRIFPRESVWEEHALARFVREIQSVDPEAVGTPVTLHVFASAFRNACVKASAYAVIAIFILLAVTFRDLRLSLLAFLPLALGTIWTVGIMGLADIHFNLANSIFMPLVVGAGVEYAVVILSRWREGRMLPGHLPFSTAKGVILAALTTTVGFGALMISHHRGIFSLGFVAWAGSLCVLVSAVVVLPALLVGFQRTVRT